MSSKHRPAGHHVVPLVGATLPNLRAGQRFMPVKAREKEDGDEVTRRIAGYEWARRVVSGPYRTGERWLFVVGGET